MDPFTLGALGLEAGGGIANLIMAHNRTYDQTADTLAKQEALRMRGQASLDKTTGQLADAKSAIMTNAQHNFLSTYNQGTDPNARQGLLQETYSPAFSQLYGETNRIRENENTQNERLREGAAQLETGAAEHEAQFKSEKQLAEQQGVLDTLSNLGNTALAGHALDTTNTANQNLIKTIGEQTKKVGTNTQLQIQNLLRMLGIGNNGSSSLFQSYPQPDLSATAVAA
jgi:hypothetical protein